MKRITSLLVCFAMFGLSVLAQDIQITGKVTSADDGSVLPGVSVVVKGTTIGTTTSIDGDFTISAPSDATLVFSFVGMKEKEVAVSGQTSINVAMEMDVTGLEEVVVTALGISREKKSLGYSASEVKGDELDKLQVVDATHALQGKVAGVLVSPSSGSPGASTRVIIRGVTSLTGSNQPLYVIDGVPINNAFASGNAAQASTSVNRTIDFGNAASDLNPNDVESINILKGAAATSLYGSRAANGVVIITTKAGKKNQDLRVDFSSSASMQEVSRLPYYQDVFGQGWSGHYASNENGSWGPKMDGADRLIGNVVDNSQRIMPFKYYENGLRDFYDYGTSYQNSLTLSGGTSKLGYYASYTNTKQDGVVPGEADRLKRNAFTFKGNGGTEHTKLDFSVNYTNKHINAVATGQGDDAGGGKTLYQEILQNPVNHYIPLYRDYNNKFDNLDNYYTPYAQNPYFIINENGNDFRSNRVISSFNISQDIIEGMKISWRGGLDYSTEVLKDWGAKATITPGSPNSSANDVLGSVLEQSRTQLQLNSDLFLSYSNSVDAGSKILKYDVTLGNNVNQRTYKRITNIASELVVPEYYDITNTGGSVDATTYESIYRLVGFFGIVSFDYDGFLFLQVNARNDVSSSLPKDNNSFFYPGVNFGFLFSELINSNVLSFGKLRASYALAGNDALPHRLDAYYNAGSFRAGGFGLSNYPIGGIAAYEKGFLLASPNLQPEITTEIEAGFDIRFINNRIGLDVAYYNKVTTDLIVEADIASSSGYLRQTTNLGQITNTGVELKLDLIPVQTSNFSWNFSLIYYQGNTILDELSEELGVSEYLINDAYEAEFVAIPGEQLGQFRVPGYKYAPDGSIIVGSNGLPVEGENRLMGSSVPDYNMSTSNTFTYKGLSLSFLLDYQKGGLMYSYTSSITYWSGNNEQSTTNDRRPWVIPNSVQEVDDGNGTISYVENSVPVHNNWHEYYSSNTNKPIEDERILEKTFFRLREVTLNWNLPSEWAHTIKLSSASLGLYGRNLILWTPADNSFVDPETSTFGNDLEGMFGEFGGAPSVRTYGVKLNLSF
jgi:TonB-linked SusC/RagA family outer membrane protein